MSPPSPGSAVCQGCGRLIGASGRACPHCGNRTILLVHHHRRLAALFSGSVSFSRILVALYTIVAIALSIVSVLEDGGRLGKVLMEGPSTGLLSAAGSLAPTRVVEHGEVWRLVNHTFLHGGLVHLLMNGLVLAMCGPIAEMVYGRARFLILYLVCGVGGATLSGFVHYDIHYSAVGASGAIFGLLGTLAVYGYRRRDLFGSSLLHRILFFLVLNAVIGFSGMDSNIDHWGHAGGLLTGLLVGVLLRPLEAHPRGEGPRTQVTAVGLIVAQLVCLGIGAWNVWGGEAPLRDRVQQTLADWKIYEENLSVVMGQEDRRDPTSMARDARVLQAFADSFEELADRLEREGEEVEWLRRFIASQRELHGLLRAQEGRKRRRELAWDLRGQMAEAPEPWTRPHELRTLTRAVWESHAQQVAAARHQWLVYWMNLAVLRTQDLEAAERRRTAAVLDSFSEVFENAANRLEEHELPGDWLRILVADQRTLHEALRGTRPLTELREMVLGLETAMVSSPWPLP